MSDPDATLNWYACAFFDILGQRDQLRKLRSLPANEQEKLDAAKIIRHTSEFVKSLRAAFRQYFDIIAKPSMDVSSLSPEHQQFYKESRQLDPRVMGFSDCFVAWIPLKGCQHTAAPLFGVWAMLYGTAAMMLISLRQKHALRGGIDIGLGTEIGPELVLPAFGFVKAEGERFVSEANAILGPRYERLRRYMEAWLVIWR